MKREVEFNSDGLKCRGTLTTPEGEGPFPIVLLAGGWCYVQEIVMPNYAEHFLDAGFATLLFDYRNFGKSEGQVRQHLDPWWQIEDYRNAISFAETLPEIDSERIAIWGISYAGGHVLIVGALDPRVKCIVSTIPVVDGYQNMMRSHGERRFADIQALILEDRRKRGQDSSNRGTMAMSAAKPEEEICTWPYPEVKRIFMDHKEQRAPLHEHWNTIESTELLLNYTVFPYVQRIVSTPTMMGVAEGDNITLWDLEVEAFRQIKSQNKELFVIPKTSHMKLYSDMSQLDILATEQKKFLSKTLIEPFE